MDVDEMMGVTNNSNNENDYVNSNNNSEPTTPMKFNHNSNMSSSTTTTTNTITTKQSKSSSSSLTTTNSTKELSLSELETSPIVSPVSSSYYSARSHYQSEGNLSQSLSGYQEQLSKRTSTPSLLSRSFITPSKMAKSISQWSLINSRIKDGTFHGISSNNNSSNSLSGNNNSTTARHTFSGFTSSEIENFQQQQQLQQSGQNNTSYNELKIDNLNPSTPYNKQPEQCKTSENINVISNQQQQQPELSSSTSSMSNSFVTGSPHPMIRRTHQNVIQFPSTPMAPISTQSTTGYPGSLSDSGSDYYSEDADKWAAFYHDIMNNPTGFITEKDVREILQVEFKGDEIEEVLAQIPFEDGKCSNRLFSEMICQNQIQNNSISDHPIKSLSEEFYSSSIPPNGIYETHTFSNEPTEIYRFEIDRLEKELSTTRDKDRKTIQSLEDKLQELIQQITTLEKDIKERQTIITNLKLIEKKKDEVIKGLEEQKEKLGSEMADYTKLKQQKQKLHDDIAKANAKNELLKKEFELAIEDKEEQQAEIKRLKSEVNKLKKELGSTQSLLSEIHILEENNDQQKENSGNTKKTYRLSMELDQSQLSGLKQSQLLDYKKFEDENKKEVEELKSKLDALELEKQKMSRELSTEKEKNFQENKKSTLDQQQRESKTKQHLDQINQLQSKIQSLEEKITNLENEYGEREKTLLDQIEELENLDKENNEKVIELEKKNNEKMMEVEKLKSDDKIKHNISLEKLTKLQAELDQSNAARKRIENESKFQLNQYNSTTTIQEFEIKESKDKISKLQAEKEELLNQIALITASNQKETNDMQQLKGSMELDNKSLESKRKQLEDEIKELNGLLETERKDKLQTQQTVKEREQFISKLESSITDLNSRLNIAKSTIEVGRLVYVDQVDSAYNLVSQIIQSIDHVTNYFLNNGSLNDENNIELPQHHQLIQQLKVSLPIITDQLQMNMEGCTSTDENYKKRCGELDQQITILNEKTNVLQQEIGEWSSKKLKERKSKDQQIEKHLETIKLLQQQSISNNNHNIQQEIIYSKPPQTFMDECKTFFSLVGFVLVLFFIMTLILLKFTPTNKIVKPN